MEYRKFGDTYIVRMDPGEEILTQLKVFAEQEGVKLASVTALGAVKDFTVGVFDTGAKVYKSLNDPRVVLFYLRADEGQRQRRMQERGDSPEKIASRIVNDREAFKMDEETERQIDCYVDTESHTLEEVSSIIYEKYLAILKERGIEYSEELKKPE